MGVIARRSKTGRSVVLVVDDDDVTREVYAGVLEAAGYVVEEAATRAKALAAARATRPDLVIIDRMLPDGDGWSAISELRRIEGLANVPVIAISGSGAEGTVKGSLLAGCDAFLEKPCDPDVVVLQVGRLLALRAPKTTMRRKRFEPKE